MADSSPLPRRLKEARSRIDGLSQKRLGISAGLDDFVASARINQYEKGKHTPNYQTIEKLAEVLGVPTAYFYTEDDDLAALIVAFAAMSKKEKVRLLKTLI